MARRSRRLLPARRHWFAVAVVLVVVAASSGCAHSGQGQRGRPASSSAELPPSLAHRPLAFVERADERTDHIFVARPDGSARRQIDHDPGCKQRPIWSPDGRRIAYRFMPGCDYERDHVVVIGEDGNGRFDLSTKLGVFGNSPSWSPDGRALAFAGMRSAQGRPDPGDRPLGLYIAAVDGGSSRRVTPRSLGEVQYPMWSPDGRTIAFQVSRDAGFELYSVAPDGTQLKRLTSTTSSAEWPMWSPDSQRIAYGVEGGTSALWVMRADGQGSRPIRKGVGVPGNWAPGEWLVANCVVRPPDTIGICAVSPDGTAQRTLLGGRDAGFAAWRPGTG
jgi:TolB protein